MPTAQIAGRHSRLLAIETPTALGHTSTLTIIDADSAPHRIDAALLRREVNARLDDLPMLRQSLVDVPLGLDRPWWRDHPGFDLDYHLRYIAVPDPDDPSSLAELVARIHSRPLDRNRPLWELYLITGLADGRAALLFKMHLAALAESTGNSLCAGLIDESADLIAEPSDILNNWTPEPGPSLHRITTQAWANALLDPVRTLRNVPRTLNTVPGLRSILNPALALMNQRAQRSIVIAEHSGITPRTSFNGRVGPHRRWARADLDLGLIGRIRSELGVSTVDVLTTVCGGALRWWLLEHDELPRESLKALVPLSVTDPDAIEGIGGVVVSLETNLHRVESRLAAVHEQIAEAVTRHGAMTAAEIRGLGGGTPLLGIVASRLLERSPLAERLMPPFNTTITSVPGSQTAQYALGARVEGIYPVLGIVDGMGLHIGAISVDDQLCLSLVSDRYLITDLDALADRIPVELDLLAAATIERR
ncbi:MAG TPA: wax ester/triacylglycerol synthase family O-acyltransferase [Ilumatobacteraceae bacterium]|nr:wax ester/triacylglycerol synthase family O-acyltransferase [Ilumatobacteraceae bacterium]